MTEEVDGEGQCPYLSTSLCQTIYTHCLLQSSQALMILIDVSSLKLILLSLPATSLFFSAIFLASIPPETDLNAMGF
jgi:hypothetical protein